MPTTKPFHYPTITRVEGHPLSSHDEIRKGETLAARNDRIHRWLRARHEMDKNLGTMLHEVMNDKWAKDDVHPFVTVDDVHDLMRDTASEQVRQACDRVSRAASNLEMVVGDAVADVESLMHELDPNVTTDENGARIGDLDSERLAAMVSAAEEFHADASHWGIWRLCAANPCQALAAAADAR